MNTLCKPRGIVESRLREFRFSQKNSKPEQSRATAGNACKCLTGVFTDMACRALNPTLYAYVKETVIFLLMHITIHFFTKISR